MRVMFLTFLASASVLAGCVSSEERAPFYDRELFAYVRCNHNNSVALASRSSDPYALAITAEASCGREERTLLIAMERRNGPGFALSEMDGFQQRAIQRNVATIVKRRA